MILKERLFLSNCDSVRQLPEAEVCKRVLLGAGFAGGVILSPNLLIDNTAMVRTLSGKALSDWLREEGYGSLSVRGMFDGPQLCLADYFRDLRGDYRLSRLVGRRKDSLSAMEHDAIVRDLDSLDGLLAEYGARFQPIKRDPDALNRAIAYRLKRNAPMRALLARHGHDGIPPGLVSRSDWYRFVNHALPDPYEATKFRLVVVDTAYNSLFVRKGEAFAIDRVRMLGDLPSPFLDASVRLRNFRREIGNLHIAWRVFSFISSLGQAELIQVLTDEALSLVEDSAASRGAKWFDRKNWFGLYPRLVRQIGVEIRHE